MVQRRFIIGSEWIYFKIYSGPKIIEKIFVYDIIPAVNSLITSGFIDSYFFVKYMDPDYHIRLRLHCIDTKNYGYILGKFNQKLRKYLNNLTITKVQIDTYNRELERYRGNEIVKFEKIFFYDSCMISTCLKRLECSDNNRYKISIRYIDALMEMCGFNIDQKISFVDYNRMAYLQEIYQSDKTVKAILNSKYRAIKNEINDCFCIDKKLGWLEVSQCIKKIDSISHNFHPIVKNELSSVIHMHINRMFRTKQRTVELVLYWYLYKYYVSQKAILK